MAWLCALRTLRARLVLLLLLLLLSGHLLAHLVLLHRLLFEALDVLLHRHARFLSLNRYLLLHLADLFG